MNRDAIRHEFALAPQELEHQVSEAHRELVEGRVERAEEEMAATAEELRWVVRRLLYPVPTAGSRPSTPTTVGPCRSSA